MDLTSTAQTIATAIPSQPSLLMIIAMLIGWALARPQQAIIEHNLAEKPWMPSNLKPWLPTIFSTLGAIVGSISLGVPLKTAFAGALVSIYKTHAVNASPDAADAKFKYLPDGTKFEVK